MKGRTGNTCAYCGTNVHPSGSVEARANPGATLTKDHVVPQLWATETDRRVKAAANTVIACQACNNVKCGHPPEIFRFFLAETRGTARFNPVDFKRFIYGLALAGLHAARTDAIGRRPPPTPRPAPRAPYTERDLRRRADAR